MTALEPYHSYPGFPGLRSPEGVEGGTGDSASPFSGLTIPGQIADGCSQQPATRPASEQLSEGPTDSSQAHHPQQTVSSVSGGASISELRRLTADYLAEQHGLPRGTSQDRLILEVDLRRACEKSIAMLGQKLPYLTNIDCNEVPLGYAYAINVGALQRSLPALSLESLRLLFIRVADTFLQNTFHTYDGYHWSLTPPSTSPAIQELKEALAAHGCFLTCTLESNARGFHHLRLVAKVKEG